MSIGWIKLKVDLYRLLNAIIHVEDAIWTILITAQIASQALLSLNLSNTTHLMASSNVFTIALKATPLMEAELPKDVSSVTLNVTLAFRMTQQVMFLSASLALKIILSAMQRVWVANRNAGMANISASLMSAVTVSFLVRLAWVLLYADHVTCFQQDLTYG